VFGDLTEKMGCSSSVPTGAQVPNDKNIHVVHSDIKVHTVISAELDFDHKTAMHIPLVRPLSPFCPASRSIYAH
jgi:hypothetical protein